MMHTHPTEYCIHFNDLTDNVKQNVKTCCRTETSIVSKIDYPL